MSFQQIIKSTRAVPMCEKRDSVNHILCVLTLIKNVGPIKAEECPETFLLDVRRLENLRRGFQFYMMAIAVLAKINHVFESPEVGFVSPIVSFVSFYECVCSSTHAWRHTLSMSPI